MNTRARIEALWEEHMRCEFELKDADATMATMTAQPLVHNIPTMIGGKGYDEVYHFYKNHFIPHLPKQVEITPVSRTVDDHRLVDEQIFRFVHDSEVDFILPNIAPTGKTIVMPLIVIVTVENNKVAEEHIYWDQAAVLKQIGWIKNEKWPVIGDEQGTRLLGKNIPFNKLLKS